LSIEIRECRGRWGWG